ncbi:hypothetical protein [Halosimplex halobium]|uniref:hypothetical protein n=1 Tax=Halosimplex halobium TaxID=3396618 RepID=UPI003F558844
MDPDSLRALGRRFWYAWGTVTLASIAAVLATTVVVAPADPWLVALTGVLAVVFVALATVSQTQGDRLDAAGTVVAAVGWAVWSVGAAVGFPGRTFWTGWTLIAVGAAVGLWADHGHRVRAAVGV